MTREELIDKAEEFYTNEINPDNEGYKNNPIHKRIEKLMAGFALSVMEEEKQQTCKWAKDVHTGLMVALCQHGTLYGVTDNADFIYCFYCGRKIERV